MTIGDKVTKVGLPGSATTMTGSGHSIGGTSTTINSAANWEVTTPIHFDIYSTTVVGTSEVETAGTRTQWKGIVTGTTIGSMQLKNGSDQNYSAGTSTKVVITHSAIRENEMADAFLAEHAALDGKHTAITATSLVTSGNVTIGGSLTEAGAVHSTMRAETVFDHINSGCVWSGDAYASTRNASCTAGVVYLAGKRLTVAAVTARSFTASKDVYCDLSDNGDGTAVWNYNDNVTNAASPALTAGRVRGAIVVVGATNIAAATSVNQGQETMVLPIASSIPYAVTDSLGNLICPRDPNRKVLGYRQITSNTTTASTTATQMVGLSMPVLIPTGRKIRLTVQSPAGSLSAVGNINLEVWDGTVGSGTRINIASNTVAGVNYLCQQSVIAVTSPSTASKTYNVGFYVSTGTVTINATATAPVYALVELV